MWPRQSLKSLKFSIPSVKVKSLFSLSSYAWMEDEILWHYPSMDIVKTLFASLFLQSLCLPPVLLSGLNQWQLADNRVWERPTLPRRVQEWQGEDLRRSTYKQQIWEPEHVVLTHWLTLWCWKSAWTNLIFRVSNCKMKNWVRWSLKAIKVHDSVVEGLE